MITQSGLKLIAQVLKDCKPGPQKQENPIYINEVLAHQMLEWHTIVKSMAGSLSQDNPKFNYAKFYKACGYAPLDLNAPAFDPLESQFTPEQE